MRRHLRSDGAFNLPILISSLAALAAVASLFAPDSHKSARIDWDPAIDANPSIFNSYAPEQQLVVKGRWAPEKIVEPTVVTTGYFATSSENDTLTALRVRVSTDGVVGELVSPLGEVRESVGPAEVGGATGGFPQDWSVRVDQGVLTLETETVVLQAAIPSERRVAANWLQATGTPLADLHVAIDLSGGALDSAGPLHAWFIWIAIFFISITVVIISRPWSLDGIGHLRKVRPSGQDLFVTGGLILSGLVSRTTYDDGWVLQWAQDVTNGPWGPATPFMLSPGSPVHLFQGFLYSSLLGVAGARQETVLGMRFLTIISIFVCWLLLSRVILPRMLRSGLQPALLATAAFVVIYGLGWMTLRAEIPLFLASVIFLSISVLRPFSRPALAITGLISAAAFAVATHPLGLMMLLPLAIVLIPILRETSITARNKWLGLLTGGSAAVVLVFFNQSLSLFLRGIDEYDDIPLDPFDEWGRFADLFRIGTITQRAWFLAGLVALVLLWILAIRILLKGGRREVWHYSLFAAAVMPLGLLFTASKWLWHYSALMAPMAIGVAFAASWLSEVPRQKTLRVLTVLGISSWIGLAVKDSEFDRQWTAPIVGTTLVLSILAVVWPRGKPSGVVGRGLLAACIVLGTVTTWHAVELARKPTNGWSFLAQSVAGIWNDEIRCGLPAVVPIADTEYSSAVAVAEQAGISVAVPSEFGLQSPCFKVPKRVNGLWVPAFGALVTQQPQDEATWLNRDELAAGCVEVAGPGTYTYPFCFRQLLPSGVPSVEASLTVNTDN